jgi:hypothetical protein
VSSQNYDGAVKGLDFVNRSDGWALLYGEGLMGTQDGGHTWSAAAEPSQGPLETVTFTDPEIGWALTDQGTLLHTLDAGVNWLSVRTPASGLSLCANSSGTLWLGGNDGNIYESSSGASWNLAFSLSNVQAPAPALGDPQPGPWLTCTGDSAWALYQWGESAGSDPFVVERTLDDGENWMALVVPRGTGLVPPNPEVAMDTPSDLGSGGPTRAWVLGYCGPCGTGSASVVITTGATSFSGTALPIATDTYASPIDAAFFGLEFGWVALREYPSSMAGSASVETTAIVATDDGGKTWHVVDPDVSR